MSRTSTPNISCIPCHLGPFCRRQQGFRRHAAGVEIIPAHLASLDKHRRCGQCPRSRSYRQAARASTNHANVGPECFRHSLQLSDRSCDDASVRAPPFHTTGISASRPRPTSAAIICGVSTSVRVEDHVARVFAGGHALVDTKFFCAVITLSRPMPANEQRGKRPESCQSRSQPQRAGAARPQRPERD